MADEPGRDVVTADSELAGIIVDDLVAAGLVGQDAQKKLLTKLVSGNFRSEDWRFFLLPTRPAETEVEV